jgi:hypothetical protein
MPKTAEIDKELVGGLKRSKKSRTFFACVTKGSSDGALILSKRRIPASEITAAKKRCGGTQVIDGTVKGDDSGKLVFETAKEPPATLPKTIKFLAQRDAGLLINPICKLGLDPATLPNELPDEDAAAQPIGAHRAPPGNGPAAIPAAPPRVQENNGIRIEEAAPAQPAVPVAIPVPPPPRPNLKKDIEARFKALQPDYEQALPIVSEKSRRELTMLHAAVVKYTAENQLGVALKSVSKLEADLRTALSEAAAPAARDDGDDYEDRRYEVKVTYDLAVGVLPELKSSMAAIEKLGGEKKYDDAIKELNKLEKDCRAALALAGKQWTVRLHKSRPLVELANRMVQTEQSGSDSAIEAAEMQITVAKKTNKPERVAQLEAEIARLKALSGPGRAIKALYDQAVQQADQLNYIKANELLDRATPLAEDAKKKLDAQVAKIQAATTSAAATDKKAFDFASQTSDAEWGFDTDADSQAFFIGAATGDVGRFVKGNKLKEMEASVTEALKRRDALLASGASPEQAGETAFANIPKNFWPDNVVREVLMYKRARKEFEDEIDAKNTAKKIDEYLENAKLLGKASFLEAAPTQEQLDASPRYKGALDMVVANLPEALRKDPGKTTLVIEDISTAVKSLGVAFGTIGIVANVADAARHVANDEDLDEDIKPVQKKLQEFERNKAVIDGVNKLLDMGLAWDSVMPAMALAADCKDMLVEVGKAVQYFENLRDIGAMGANAKLDPESMMALPLARMATKQKIRASQATIKAFSKAAQAAGDAAMMTGAGAVAGGATKLAGKGLQLASMAAFWAVNKVDGANCVAAMQAAAGPPPNRKAQTLIFKNSSKYARFALAHAAVVQNDPWAIAYLDGQGLTDKDLDSPGTSVQIVREFMLTTGGGSLGDKEADEVDPTLRSQDRAAAAKKQVSATPGLLKNSVVDKLVGRDATVPYDPEWRAGPVALTQANWQETKKGAIAAGWYDTRSGLGSALGSYEGALKFYNQQLTVPSADALVGAMEALQAAIRKVGTMANGQKSIHEGMLDYIDRLWIAANQERMQILQKRSDMIDVAEFGNVPPDKLAQLKKEKVDEAVKAATEKNDNQTAARKARVRDYWHNHSHATPFGNMRLAEFVGKAFDVLKLDGTGMHALSNDLFNVQDQSIEELDRLMSGAPEDKFDDELQRQVTRIDSHLVETLRKLANDQVAAMKVRRASEGKPRDEDDDEKWQAPTTDLGAKTWAEVKKGAIKSGLLDNATGIGKALEVYDKAVANYQKNKENETAIRIVLGSLRGANDAFTKFTPIHKTKKLPHVGMVAYRTAILAKVGKALTDYEALRQKAAQTAATAPPKQAWKATDFKLAKGSWESMRDQAIADGLVDRRTGLPGAFGSYETGVALVTASAAASDRIKAKAKAQFTKAAGELQKKLEAFTPQTKNGLSHPGMAAYRLKMLEALRTARAANGG